MAFTTIPSSLIAVGKAITNTLLTTYIKDNFDDHETRLNSLEGASGKIVVFNEPIFNAANFSTASRIHVWRSPSAFNLTDCKISIETKGSLTGTLEVDIKKYTSSDYSSASSVFTTKPSIAYAGASNYEESSNAALDNSAKVISAGDYLFLDITSMPSGGTLGIFNIYLIGEAS